ncbi:hypothetical protein [Maribacter thermophilus]|nr:hypothetical protein [Maribacter thermophilus]
MAVEHLPTKEVHLGIKGGNTGCGFDTTKNADHWTNTNSRVTCKKNGCRN